MLKWILGGNPIGKRYILPKATCLIFYLPKHHRIADTATVQAATPTATADTAIPASTHTTIEGFTFRPDSVSSTTAVNGIKTPADDNFGLHQHALVAGE